MAKQGCLWKLVCTDPESEKSQVEKKALAAGFSTSKYLKRQAFADLHSRAMLVELVSCMVSPIKTDRLFPSVGDRLFEIAQAVLDGAALEDGRERVAQVCKFEAEGD